MKTFPRSLLLLVLLASCVRAPAAATSPEHASTPTLPPQQTLLVPHDLAFSAPLVQLLSRSGLHILSVQGSTYMSMLSSTDDAVWIETDQGVLEAVFFADPAEAAQIHITPSAAPAAGRYVYTIQAPSPTLLHDQTIDAAFPLYFTVNDGIFMVTSSADLNETLHRVFPGR